MLADVKRQARGDSWPEVEELAFREGILAQYEEQSSAYYATARLWDDGVIDPVETRIVLIASLEAALSAPLPQEEPYGVFRM